MFERFTDRGRRVLVLAQEEARLLKHNFIGTEHILLGLIHEEEGIAATALASMGVRLDSARQKVEEKIGPSGSATTGSPPFTPRAKKALELALREALQLQHNYIGTEHLLLGLLKEGEGVAVQALVSLGVDLSALRERVFELLAGRDQDLDKPARAPGPIQIVARSSLQPPMPLGPRLGPRQRLSPESLTSGAVELTHRDGWLTGTLGGQTIDLSLELPAHIGQAEGELGDMVVSASWNLAQTWENAAPAALRGVLGGADLVLNAWVHHDLRFAFDHATIEGQFASQPVWAYVEEGDPGSFSGTFATYGIFAGANFSLRGTVKCGYSASVGGAICGYPIALEGHRSPTPPRVKTITGTYEGPTPFLLLVSAAVLFHM